MEVTRIRVFVGSPTDVAEERKAVFRVIDQLNDDPLIKDRYQLEGIGWDSSHYPKPTWLSPQQAISQGLPKPSDCDVALFFFWRRIGTPLSADSFPLNSGGEQVTGSQWEFHDAMDQAKEHGSPWVMTYRCTRPPSLPDDEDPMEFAKQVGAVRQFFDGFQDVQGHFNNDYHEYATVEALAERVSNDLKAFLQRLDRPAPPRPNKSRDVEEPLVPKQYLARLKATVARVELLGLDLKESISNGLPQVYVPAVTSAGMRGQDDTRSPDRTNSLLLELLGESSVYLPGDPGSGKSTFCRWVAYVVANGAVPAHEITPPEDLREALPETLHNRLPLLIPMRDFASHIDCSKAHWSRKDLENAILLWLKNATLSLVPETFTRNLKQGNALLLIDGVDEVPETLGEGQATRYPRNALLTGLAAALPDWLKAGNRVLITSRPYGLNAAQRAQLDLETMQLLPLDGKGQQLFVSRWYAAADHSQWQSLAEGLVKEMEGRQELESLRQNPLLLTALCVKFKEGKRLPHDIMQLFDSVVEQVLYNRYLGSDLERRKVRWRLEVVALSMQWGIRPEARHEVPRPEVILDEVERALAVYANANPTTEGDAIQVAERSEDLLNNSGLLLPAGEGKVAFYHLIFQDFLAAERLVREGQSFAAMLIEYACHAEWRRCLMFQFAREVEKSGNVDRPLALLDNLLDQVGPAALADSAAPALVLADCLEIARGKASAQAAGLGDWQARFRRVCIDGLQAVAEPKERNELWLALGRMDWDERPGIGLDRVGLPAIDWLPVPGSGEPEFYIARYPVTHRQFQAFLEAEDGYKDRRWWEGFEEQHRPPVESRWSEPNAPRVDVDWYAANAFCRWLTWKGGVARPGWEISLPTEAQWRQAYVGNSEQDYPWEGEFLPAQHANIEGSGIGRTSAVGLFPAGQTNSGALDMAGNTFEWCLDEDEPYSFDKQKRPTRVLRGGSWILNPDFARSACRYRVNPDTRYFNVGFRVLCSGPLMNTDH